MKRVLLLFFMLATQLSWGQKKELLIDFRAKYTFSDGYSISIPYSAAYDKQGVLWISGNSLDENQFVLGSSNLKIQRFDGLNFFDLKLPKTKEEPINASFISNQDQFFIYLNYAKSPSELFKINTHTLEFKLIEDYSSLTTKYRYTNYFILDQKIHFAFKEDKALYLYEIVNEKMQLLDGITTDGRGFSIEPLFNSTEGKYAVLNLGNGLLYLINSKGKFQKIFTEEDFFLNTIKYENIVFLNYFFTKNSSPHFSYTNSHNFLKLDTLNLTFHETGSSNFLKDRIAYWWNSASDQLLVLEKKTFKYALHGYDLTKNNISTNGEIEIDGYIIAVTKNANKEVVILANNTLEYLKFRKNKIKTYLKEKSVRNIKEVSKNKYIVATDINGLYELNTKTSVEKEIHFTLKGQKYDILYPRDIFEYDGFFIFNDRTSLLKVDSTYNIVERYKHLSEFEEVIRLGDTIFKAGANHGGILKFSLKDNSYRIVAEANSIRIREFAIHKNELYGITLENGIIGYQKGKLSFYMPEKELPENLLSISSDNNYGLLITTKYGKIYQFNTVDNKFKLLFEDQLKASIVGVLSDQNKTLWMNTFAGIITFNPISQKTNRFTKKDGIYELEGNRYSSHKDSQGNFLFGSFKGLSVLNPNEIEKNKESPILKFSSFSFFDIQKNEWITRSDPDFVTTKKEIILPSSNQRFSAKVSLSGVVNYNNYKYRYRLVKDSEKENMLPWNRHYLQNEILFSNLSAGTYTLQIELLNSINEKVSLPLELKIISKEIFYRTWWFALFLIFSIIVFFGFLSYQFKSKQKLFAANKIAVNEAKIKEAMMLEIHHRIKNNLQVVSGLLSLQAFNSQNEELKLKLKDSQGRIESIAGIHNILYKGDSQEKIAVEEYFNDIITYNKTLYKKSVSFNLDIDTTSLAMDKAIPLALIFNELIINSYKHAFENVKSPNIYINFKEENSEFKFFYTDNGEFINKSEERISMGMKIISMMITQLKGKQRLEKKSSFHMEILFPKD